MPLKKLLSYLWPQTTKTPSDHSGMLEVTWYKGKKLLDTQHANYSYGLLQKVLEKGLLQVNFNKVQSVLVLGLGGGSVVHSLRKKFKYQGIIHAVEFDAKIIALAQSEFGIATSETLSIFHDDAYAFVQNCTTHYDLIVVDLFIDQKVPPQFLSPEFCEALFRISNQKILYNLGINLNAFDQAHAVSTFFKRQSNCSLTLLEQVKGKNTLLLIKKLADLKFSKIA